MKKKTILFRGQRADNGEVVEGYYGIKGEGTDLEKHFIMTNELQPNVTIPFFYFFDNEVIPESVSQYHHTTGKGERIFLPIFYEETTGIVSKLTQLNLGDSVEINSDSFPAIRVQCSVINKSLRPQGLRLRTSGNKELGVVTVFCERR